MRDTSRRLRRDSTPTERILWQRLRAHAFGVRFRRQHPVEPHIADFAAPAVRLIIELDGGQHADGADAERDAALAAAGWRVLRFWNNEVRDNLDGVLARIGAVVAELRARHPHPDPLPQAGEGDECAEP